MRRHRALLTGIAVLLSGTLLFSSAMIWKELSGRQKEKEEFSALAELVEAPEANPPVTSETPPAEADEPDEAAELRDLAPLFAQNGDCIGWLSIPGTQINYPVMHTPEEPQKYLRRSFYGEYSQSGVPFLDWRCSLDSDNLIIYGHNMKNGTMFGELKNYLDEEFRLANPVIELQTEGGLEYYTVFAVAVVEKSDPWYSFIDASGSEGFAGQVAAIIQKSLYDTGAAPVFGQQIITLSTCYGSSKDGRLLVIGVKQ